MGLVQLCCLVVSRSSCLTEAAWTTVQELASCLHDSQQAILGKAPQNSGQSTPPLSKNTVFLRCLKAAGVGVGGESAGQYSLGSPHKGCPSVRRDAVPCSGDPCSVCGRGTVPGAPWPSRRAVAFCFPTRPLFSCNPCPCQTDSSLCHVLHDVRQPQEHRN